MSAPTREAVEAAVAAISVLIEDYDDEYGHTARMARIHGRAALATLTAALEAQRKALETIEYWGRADIANPPQDVKHRMWQCASAALLVAPR